MRRTVAIFWAVVPCLALGLGCGCGAGNGPDDNQNNNGAICGNGVVEAGETCDGTCPLASTTLEGRPIVTAAPRFPFPLIARVAVIVLPTAAVRGTISRAASRAFGNLRPFDRAHRGEGHHRRGPTA